MTRSFVALILISLLAFPIVAYADGLDDASIRALYARSDTAVGSPEKSRLIMEEKLSASYTLKNTLTQIVDDNPPVVTQSSFGKRVVIENALRGYSIMQVDHYKKTISDIRYSPDHLTAYVTSKTASSGVINVPDAPGGALKARYEDGEGCVDQLTLLNAKIQFVQSACNEKFVVKP